MTTASFTWTRRPDAEIYDTDGWCYTIERRDNEFRLHRHYHAVGSYRSLRLAKAMAEADHELRLLAAADAKAFGKIMRSRPIGTTVTAGGLRLEWGHCIDLALLAATNTEGANEHGTGEELAAFWSAALDAIRSYVQPSPTQSTPHGA